MIIAAIDPGKRGAIVVVDTQSSKAWYEKLSFNENGLLVTRLNTKFVQVRKVILEKIRGRGGWGASQTFNMGFYFGQVLHEIVNTGIDYELITPDAWTASIHRDVDIKGNAKEKSLAAYHMFFPHDPVGKSVGKKGYHDGILDALLIATYYLIRDNEPVPRWEFTNNVGAFKCT